MVLGQFARTLSIITLLPFVFACTNSSDEANLAIPNSSETCGGAADQSRYIVHYKTGQWEFHHSTDREKFKEEVVRPRIKNIDFIEYDQKIKSFDNFPSNQLNAMAMTGIDNWGAQNINAQVMWKNGDRGQGVVVAVIDSGIDKNHDQLKNQIAINELEAGTDAMGRDRSTNGVDDDENGYVDDAYGFNFYDNNADVTDNVGHGTHVAGVILAEHSDTEINTGYTQGVAPAAKVVPIKFLDADGGLLSGALKGIDYAAARGAQIINASWGGNACSKALKQKISEIAAKNILFVAAAGNSGNNIDFYPEYPAAFDLPFQITVGALSRTLLMADYSNYSRNLVHVFAPGSNVVSTVPDNGYASYSGTSMATPFFAGAAATVLSKHPNMEISELKAALLRAVVQNNVYANSTRGRLDLNLVANVPADSP